MGQQLVGNRRPRVGLLADGSNPLESGKLIMQERGACFYE